MDYPTAVVVGLRKNGFGVVRALGREGVPVLALDDSINTPYAATRFGEKVRCSEFAKESFDEARVVERLVQIGRQLGQRAVLIPTMEKGITPLSKHRDQLEPYYSHCFPKHDVLETLLSKAGVDAYARRAGFRVPATASVSDTLDLAAAARELRAPYVLKPKVKTVEFGRNAPRKAFLLKDAEALSSTYAMVAQWQPEVVVQEWIQGPETNIVFCLYYFDEFSRDLAWFAARKIRQYRPYTGNATLAEPWSTPTLREEGLRFFGGIGYQGFAGIEFKIDDRDRQLYLIEPTIGRTDRLVTLAAANGVNIPYIGYRHMAGLPAVPWRQSNRRVKYFLLKRDFRSARYYWRRGELSLAEWTKSLRGKKQHALFAWDDPGPFLFQVSRPLHRHWRRGRRAINRVATAVARLFS
jgi:predicted ATP-grasp superfamily ATP-dependent carboligase